MSVEDGSKEDHAPPPGLSRVRPVAFSLLAKPDVFTWRASRRELRRRPGGASSSERKEKAKYFCSEYSFEQGGPRRAEFQTVADSRASTPARASTPGHSQTKSQDMTRSTSMTIHPANPALQASTWWPKGLNKKTLASLNHTGSASSLERIQTPVRPSSSFGWTGPRLAGYNGPRDFKPLQGEIKILNSEERDACNKLLSVSDYQRQFCRLDVSDKGGDRGGSQKGLIQGWEDALKMQERRCAASQKKERRLPAVRQSPFASSALDSEQFIQDRPASTKLRPQSPIRPTEALSAPPEVRVTRAKGAVLVGGSDYQRSFTALPKQPKVESLTDKLYEGWQLVLTQANNTLSHK